MLGWYLVGAILLLFALLPAEIVSATGSGGAGDPALFTADIRNYWFQRNFAGATRDREDFALGGVLRLRNKLTPQLDFGLGLYVSNGLGLNDDDKAVYGLLGRDSQGGHRDYAVLGEGFLRYRQDGIGLSLGRLGLQTPWVNPHDVRMTPNSFEAGVLVYRGVPDIEVTFAQVLRMKRKNDDRFLPMSEHVVGNSDEPVTLAGLVYKGLPGYRVQLWDYLARQMWNDIYLRLDRRWTSEQGTDWFANLRFLKRDSQGDALAGPLDTYHFGVTFGLRHGGFATSLAWSRNGEQGITRVWGHDMTISNQVYVADRARETAWKFAADYRFDSQGWPGLKAGLVYSLADSPDTGPYASPDRGELNLELRYEFGEALEGLSLRLRYAVVNEWGTDSAENLGDGRLYLRYKFDY